MKTFQDIYFFNCKLNLHYFVYRYVKILRRKVLVNNIMMNSKASLFPSSLLSM